MKKNLSRLLSLVLVAMLAIAMLAGCGSNNGGTNNENTEKNPQQTSGEKRDDVIIATANEPPTLAPYQHSAVASTYINLLTHDNFLRSDVETLEPVPGIITKWDNITDTQWKFYIRDDVKRRCAEVIQSNLQELGITMNLESMDLATYLSAAAEGNFEATIGGCTTANTLGFIEYKFHSKSIGGANSTRTNDPKIDELWDKAAKTLDDTERLAILEECAAYLNELCPHVPTYQVNVVRAYNSNLQGFVVNASGNTYWQHVSWAE